MRRGVKLGLPSKIAICCRALKGRRTMFGRCFGWWAVVVALRRVEFIGENEEVRGMDYGYSGLACSLRRR